MIEQMHFQDSELVHILYIAEALVQTAFCSKKPAKDPYSAQIQRQSVNQNQKRVGPHSELCTEPSSSQEEL